jgi:hypothetical protein
MKYNLSGLLKLASQIGGDILIYIMWQDVLNFKFLKIILNFAYMLWWVKPNYSPLSDDLNTEIIMVVN